MASPVTARSGIRWAGAGHGDRDGRHLPAAGPAQPRTDRAALAIGTALAWVSGKKVAITDMPQMVALYNGMGGGSAAAIGAVELLQFPLAPAGAAVERVRASRDVASRTITLVLAVVGALIGAVSLSGSVIAWAKLDGRMDKRYTFPGQQLFNGAGVRGRGGAGRHRDPYARRAGDHRLLRRRAGVRRADDAADRRRRHAGGDLAVQRADRPGGRVRRLRARQRGADHRRHHGRRGRHAADAADGQGDEPADQQRAVLQLRRRRRRRRRSAARRSPSRPATSPR